MNSTVNWIAAYNRLFVPLDRTGTPTYYRGPSFLRMVRQVDPGSPRAALADDLFKMNLL